MKLHDLSLVFAAAALFAAPLCAQAPAADPYRDEPFVFERSDTTVTMKADGTGDTVQHVILRVQSEGVARQFSVLNLSYASANSTGSMDFVRVHKPDGTTVNTPVDDAMEMPAEVSREAPMYSDVKEKHLPVRSLAAGDRLEYQFHTVTTKALAPGQFWGAEHFIVQGGVILSQTLTLQVPAQTYVQVWSPNHPAAPLTRDGMKIWTWTSSQTKASARDENGKMTAADVKDPDEDSDGRKLPSVAWTTFHSWAEVGDWYRSLAEQRLQPTATVRTKADELTKNAKTPQEQAEALYRFVATQIRYISISFGVGRFQPHTPDEVLDHGYGDCKDKDTLLESLLRAKGLTTAPVLIGAGIAPVPDVPSPAVFNHVITTVELPGIGRSWLDSTAEVAPFRVLVPMIRDQNALVVPSTGLASLQKTPANPPFPYLDRYDSVTTLDAKGVLKGHIELTSRSDSELGFRLMMQRLAPAQWDEAMQYVSSAMNFGGKVSHADLRQSDPAAPVHLSYDYVREDFGDWQNNRIYSNLPALAVTTIDKDKAPEHNIDLGAPRTMEAHSTITLPQGDRVELPEAVHVKRDYATYDETYRFVGGKLITDRLVVVKQHKLAKEQWKDYLAFQKAIGMNDGETYIQLIPPADGTSAGAATTSKATETYSASAQYLINQMTAAWKRHDLDAVRTSLQVAVQQYPDAPYVHSWQGFVAVQDQQYDEAIADYNDELKLHPEESHVAALLSSVYAKQKRYAEALKVLKDYSGPRTRELISAMVSTQRRMGDYAGALATDDDYLSSHPTDVQVQVDRNQMLYDLHRYPDAAAAAKKTMEGSDDPYLINNEVYLLSEMKTDLPFAEEQSRRSISMLEKRTAGYSIDAANSKAFADSSNLTASWDTLAYILMLEGKPKEALPYFEASWFNRQDIAVGNHLAQAYEALGRKGDALATGRMALLTDHAADSKDDYAEVKALVTRLENNPAKPSASQPFSLQELHTLRVQKPVGAEGGGTVRVQLAIEGIAAAMLVSGNDSLKPAVDKVRNLKISGATPPGSEARLLRDGVLYCGKTSDNCLFVFMPTSGIAAEGAEQKE